MITADYHTHTIFSHGKGTIEENVNEARAKGLKEIAITDHGLKHIFMGISPKKVAIMRDIIAKENSVGDIKVYMGVEANIISRSGDIDILPHQRDMFDLVICGFHKLVWGSNAREFFKFIAVNDIYHQFNIKETDKLIKRNTEALKLAVQKNKIDILSHINHDMRVDVVEVAKACRDYGTYIELNSKKRHLTSEQIVEIAKTGVQFVIDSDAHSVDRVGDFALGLDMANKAGLDKSKIANFDRLPTFRSK